MIKMTIPCILVVVFFINIFQLGGEISIPIGKSRDDVLNDLKSMRRKDILSLFQHCEVPDDFNTIQGEWDGLLLNNNLVLVS